MAALAAVEKWRKVAAKHGSEKLLTSATTNSPSGRSFVPLRSLLKSPSLLTKARAGMPSPRQVSTALAQLEKGTKVLSNQTLAKPHRKEQVSEDSSLRAEIVNFNITQYLVGSREYGESSAKEGEPNLRAQGVSVPITFEALGFPSLSSSPPRLTSKAVRHLADILVENRFRFCIFPAYSFYRVFCINSIRSVRYPDLRGRTCKSWMCFVCCVCPSHL